MTDNKAGRFSFEFEIADLLIVARALQTGAATALVSSAPKAQKRLSELANVLLERSPVPTRYRNEGYAFFEAFSAATDAQSSTGVYLMNRKGQFPAPDSHAVIVAVDGRKFAISEWVNEPYGGQKKAREWAEIEELAASVPKVAALLEEVRPMDCDRLVECQAAMTLSSAYLRDREAFAEAEAQLGGMVDDRSVRDEFIVLKAKCDYSVDMEEDKGLYRVDMMVPSRFAETLKARFSDPRDADVSLATARP